MKEEIKYITFSEKPNIKRENKHFELLDTVKITINTTKRNLLFNIYKGYSWESRFISDKSDKLTNIIMLYNYIKEFRIYIINEVIKDDKMSIIKYLYFIVRIILWLLRSEK